MKPIGYMALDGSLHATKETAGANAIPLIPKPITITQNRILSAARRVHRRCGLSDIDIPLIRAMEREHGILFPEDC